MTERDKLYHQDGPYVGMRKDETPVTPKQAAVMRMTNPKVRVVMPDQVRSSNSQPNLQNLVTRTPLGTEIREAFSQEVKWPPGSFALEAERLARAVEALPIAQWISVTERLPKCAKSAHALGVQVLVWPHAGDCAIAYYGRRVTGKPAFYLYGAVHHPTHWMPLPEGPK